jgi:hypothetical protein
MSETLKEVGTLLIKSFFPIVQNFDKAKECAIVHVDILINNLDVLMKGDEELTSGDYLHQLTLLTTYNNLRKLLGEMTIHDYH